LSLTLRYRKVSGWLTSSDDPPFLTLGTMASSFGSRGQSGGPCSRR
jgi:hypothetical protein